MAYIRKTIDEYQLLCNYGYGWECILTEETKKDITERKKGIYRKRSAISV